MMQIGRTWTILSKFWSFGDSMHEIIEMTALPQFLKSTSIHKFAYLIGKAQRTIKIVLGIEATHD